MQTGEEPVKVALRLASLDQSGGVGWFGWPSYLLTYVNSLYPLSRSQPKTLVHCELMVWNGSMRINPSSF
jgi:hypothetical protein